MSYVKKFFLLLILGLLALGAFIWFFKPDIMAIFFQNLEYSRNLYRQGRELQDQKDYKAAYYTYSRISPGYKIRDVVLFQQAKCAEAIEDEKTAIRKYQNILSSYSKSPLASLASYSLGQAYIRYGKNFKAEKQFLHTLKNFSGTDYALASFYYLGELNRKDNPELAAEYWLKYIALAPAGVFAMDSYKGLKALNRKLSPKDQRHIAIALFMQEKYSEALDYFNRLPHRENWYYKAMSHKFRGNRQRALELLRDGIRNLLNDDISRPRIEKAMLTYVELSYDSRYSSWSNILHWTDKARDFALFHKAQLMSLKKARKLYGEIYEKHPYGSYASEALWNLFWYEYDNNDLDEALELGHKHIALYQNTNASPAVHFWLGKIYERKNNSDKAEKFYKNILLKFPDSYYAFRALGRLKVLGGEDDPEWSTSTKNSLPVEEIEVNLPYSYDKIVEKHGSQAAELLLLEDYETARLFIRDDAFIDSWIKLKQDAKTSSIVRARNAISVMRDKPDVLHPVWKLIYPVYYPEEINKNAGLNNLDPVIVISLMKEESHFNPFAVSSSNAMGLMQVLPGTARDITCWKKLGRYNHRELFDPAVNIRIGAAYLGFTRDVFDGNMLFSVAAYNSGPGAVQSWLKQSSYKDWDRFVENIPYLQTRNYVKKVFGSYWNYKRIYGFG